ncbi:MAG: hypothetical protein IPM77_08370 [Crocinitomicaceae bacterium]|nr:hypothetical protein [Crocinitomicaceae bacterium]
MLLIFAIFSIHEIDFYHTLFLSFYINIWTGVALVFSETAFKKWLNEKDVKCLKYVSADLEYLNFKNYRYSAEKAIVRYYFDESGVIDFLRKEEIEISLLDDAKTEDNYYFILDSIFPSMPWKMSQADIYILQEYNLSKFYPKIRCMSMYDAVAPDGTVFEESRLVYSKDSSFKFYYHYNLIQEVQFEYGQINSVKDYDLRGDFYIPQLSEISYVPMNDSVSILTLKGYLNFYEKGTYVGRDTIVQYPFYRKNFKNKQKLEFGVRILDTNNVYIHYPLYTAEEWVTATEKIKIDSRAFNAFQMLGAFGDHHWDVSYVFLVQKGAVHI